MALPPTGLTTALAGATTPAAMYAVFRTHGCLSLRGRLFPGRVPACLAAAVAEHRIRTLEPQLDGPTLQDAAAAALARSPYLSWRGRHLHAAAA
jgi:hypothetical protein